MLKFNYYKKKHSLFTMFVRSNNKFLQKKIKLIIILSILIECNLNRNKIRDR